ncbi:MAG: SurA N-terminal domain-containing protein [Bacteriovorax sp.]|nr:SurA N-terminal domain-containing protein [Bacteriovorax sp.]
MKFASRFFFLFVLFSSFNVGAKLLDKIAAVVDDNIISLSQVIRVNNNLAIKKNVAPMIYDKASYTNEEILNISINKYLVRSKLSDIGYTITDDQVEAQIKTNQERLGVDRKSLMGFLKQQGTAFDEYFEALREAIEYSYFVNRVISPMISISEQDVKNTYYKNNIKDSRMNFKYSLIDYAISKDSISKPSKGQMEEIVKQYRINSNLPEAYSTMTVSNLDDITEEGIAPEMKNLLKVTDEGSMTTPILLAGSFHIFYLAKKDLVETEAFASQKDKIKDSLFEKQVKAEIAVWFERERNKHYIKISL